MPRAVAGEESARGAAPAEARIESQLARAVASPGRAARPAPARAAAEGVFAAAAGPPASISRAGDMSENDADALPNKVPAG
jgi:hypothetical protein